MARLTLLFISCLKEATASMFNTIGRGVLDQRIPGSEALPLPSVASKPCTKAKATLAKLASILEPCPQNVNQLCVRIEPLPSSAPGAAS